MTGILDAAKTIKRATLPALFLASTATVKQIVHPSSYVAVGAAMTIWEIYNVYGYSSVLSAQSVANYKLQHKREEGGDGAKIDFESCAAVQVKWFAYSMVLCKGVNSAIAIMDSLAELPEGSSQLSNFAMTAASIVVAVFFGVSQAYGQLGSLLVSANEEDPDEADAMDAWRERGERVSPALPIIFGSASDAWFYNVTLFHAASTFFDFMLNKQHSLHALSVISGDASDASENTLMMLGNGLFWGVCTLNVFTFIIVAQGWLEKFNDYLQLNGEASHVFPQWFQKLVRNTAFKFNEESNSYEEWQPLRNLVTHVKSLTGGLSLAAIVIDQCRGHDIDTSSNGFDILKIIAPLIVLIGHAELSDLHNLVNSNEGKIPNLWNGYGVFSCMHSTCCERNTSDTADMLMFGYPYS